MNLYLFENFCLVNVDRLSYSFMQSICRNTFFLTFSFNDFNSHSFNIEKTITCVDSQPHPLTEFSEFRSTIEDSNIKNDSFKKFVSIPCIQNGNEYSIVVDVQHICFAMAHDEMKDKCTFYLNDKHSFVVNGNLEFLYNLILGNDIDE